MMDRKRGPRCSDLFGAPGWHSGSNAAGPTGLGAKAAGQRHLFGVPVGILLAAFLALLEATAAAAAAPAAPDSASLPYPHGRYRAACSECHSADTWSPAPANGRFDHSRFGVPLQGAHSRTACRTCHGSLDFTRTTSACAD